VTYLPTAPMGKGHFQFPKVPLNTLNIVKVNTDYYWKVNWKFRARNLQGSNARKVNCSRVQSAYILEPVGICKQELMHQCSFSIRGGLNHKILIILIIHIIVSYDQNISLIFYVKDESHVRFRHPSCVYITVQRQCTTIQKMRTPLK